MPRTLVILALALAAPALASAQTADRYGAATQSRAALAPTGLLTWAGKTQASIPGQATAPAKPTMPQMMDNGLLARRATAPVAPMAAAPAPPIAPSTPTVAAPKLAMAQPASAMPAAVRPALSAQPTLAPRASQPAAAPLSLPQDMMGVAPPVSDMPRPWSFDAL